MQEEGYRFLDHVTDALVEAWGPSLERAFAQSARAFFETMIHVDTVRPLVQEEIDVRGHDKLELLYNWLEALLLKFEIESKVFVRFDVHPIEESDGGLLLRAIAFGEPYDEEKHGRRVGVKGITYHQMLIDTNGSNVKVRFLLDL